MKRSVPINPPQPLAIVRPNNPEFEVVSTPLLPSSSDLVGVSEAARNNESNVFEDILDTIEEDDWLDGLVDQALRKKTSLGSISAASSLEESRQGSSNFDDRPIGTIMAAVKKQKVAKKGRKRPSKVVDEDTEEDVPPLRRKNEKTKDVRASEAPKILPTASSIERLTAKAAEKSKKVKEAL